MRPNYSEFEDSHPAIRAVVGYADLELWTEAAAEFAALPDDVRMQPGLWRLRVRVAAGANDFSGGPQLAWSGWMETAVDRAVSGAYLFALALHYEEANAVVAARACLFAGAMLWPESGIFPPEMTDFRGFSEKDARELVAQFDSEWMALEASRPAPLTPSEVHSRMDGLNA